MDMAKINYLEKELFTVAPLPVDEQHFPYGFDVQIRSERGNTKWLRITPAQMKAIEMVLLEKEMV